MTAPFDLLIGVVVQPLAVLLSVPVTGLYFARRRSHFGLTPWRFVM